MKYYEQQIQKFSRKMKEIEESRDPKVFRATKLYLQLTKEKWESQLDAWKRGRPKIDGWSSFMRVYRAMGFENFAGPAIAEYSTDYMERKDWIEKAGFPEKCCERVMLLPAMMQSGDYPKMEAIHCDGHGCDPDKYYPRSLGDWFDLPVYYVDIPLVDDDKPEMESLNYVRDQLGEFIEWAEKTVPGVKYDEGKLIEMQEIDAMGGQYRKDIYELLKHVPCPISPHVAIAQTIDKLEPSRFPDMKKALEYIRIYRDEVGEVAANGRGPYEEERLRFIWAGHTHELMAANPAKTFLERKIALPLSVGGDTTRDVVLRSWPIGQVSEYGVKLSPLQEEAKTCLTRTWGGTGMRWVNTTLTVARDMGAHGIIHFNLIGCTPMRSMGSVVAERAEKELGIPTLNLEGRILDKDYMTQEQFEQIMSPFIDKCFNRAGKLRQ